MLILTKTISAILLIFVHAHIAISTNDGLFTDLSAINFIWTEKLMFLSVFIMLIPMIAGFLFERENIFSFKDVFKISIFLSFFGLIMNYLSFGIGYIFSWNVLQFLPISFLLIYFLDKYFNKHLLFLISIIFIFTSGILRNLLDQYSSSYLISILIGNESINMFWPLFPWFGVVLFAFLMSFYIKNNLFKVGYLPVASLLFFYFSFLLGDMFPKINSVMFWGSGFFRPEISFILSVIGLFFALIYIDLALVKRFDIKNKFIILMNQGFLFIYVFQMYFSYKIAEIFKWKVGIVESWYYLLYMCLVFVFTFLFAYVLNWFMINKRLSIVIRKIR